MSEEFISSINQPDDPSAQVNPADIRLAAMNLLARREHSVWELRNKLRRRFSDESVIDAQLCRLTGEGLQSDARFAESYARQRMNRGYGPVRLREELRERGVSDVEVATAMAELEVDWCSLAIQVIQKKFGSLEPRDLKEKARRARFMQYRGFTVDHYLRLNVD